MPQSGTLVTRSSIIDDFIANVMQPAQNTNRWHSTNLPTNTVRIWTNGSIITVASYPLLDPSYMESQYFNMTNPSTGNITPLNPDNVTAYVIVDVLRVYARNTSLIRRIQMGIFFTQYFDGQGVRTDGFISDNPYAHIGGRIDGTNTGSHPTGIEPAHLSNNFLVNNTDVSAGIPSSGGEISASNLNSFISALRDRANPYNNPIVDLRICHSSCHSNCHSSRGRR